MKKLILLGLLAISLTGCNNKSDKSNNSNEPDFDYKIYVIDGCEYIGSLPMYHTFLTHKGNCKYCAERNRKWKMNSEKN